MSNEEAFAYDVIDVQCYVLIKEKWKEYFRYT